MKRYTLQGLDCANCAAAIENALRKSPSVRSATVNFAAKSLSIDTDDLSEVKKIIRTIEPIDLVPYGQEETQKNFFFRKETIRTASSLVFFAAAVLFQDRIAEIHRYVPLLLFVAAWLAAGWSVLIGAAKNIFHGRVFDENFLMTVSTIGAFSIGALSEAAAVMIFYRIGETFQDLSVERSRKSIKSLLAVRPDSASVLKGSELVTMKPEDVLPGTIIVVKPGEKIPLDGEISEGASSVDTSSLTGESLPRSVKRGDSVLSGTVNLRGTITVRVTKPFAESSVSKMLELVENASEKKASRERFITSFARVYTPIVVAAAAALAVIPPLAFGVPFHDWLYKACLLLVISCPCALVVSIPLSYFGGIGGASRRGILVKGSTVFDSLVNLQTVVFDKTGTLTKGVFKVKYVVSENGFSQEEILRFAADAELHSNHPIAVSIRESFGREVNHDEIENYSIIPGLGVEAVVQGRHVLVGNDRLLHDRGIDHRICSTEGTVVHVVVDNIHAGYIIIADELKDDAVETIRKLKQKGIRTVMLTGDTPDTAAAAADELKIDEFKAGLLPEEKVSEIEKIMEHRKGTVAFVGDGVNDAPVIARADIGVAMGALGSDAAIETADLVIMSDAPMKICEAAQRAKKVRRIVSQNIVFALGIKLIVAGMGIAGIATMWEAVFADMGVALIAIFNAMRALR